MKNKYYPDRPFPDKAIALLSGGLDSSVASLDFAQNGKIELALTFDYGQKAFAQEKKSAEYLCQCLNCEHQVIKIPEIKLLSESALNRADKNLDLIDLDDLDKKIPSQSSAKAVWVPNRNGLFLNFAALYAEAKKVPAIIVGFNWEEAQTFPDNTATFINAINASFFYSTMNQVQVIAPTIDMTKKEIVARASQLELDLDQIWSCYDGLEKPCEKCESCLRLARALKENTHAN